MGAGGRPPPGPSLPGGRPELGRGRPAPVLRGPPPNLHPDLSRRSGCDPSLTTPSSPSPTRNTYESTTGVVTPSAWRGRVSPTILIFSGRASHQRTRSRDRDTEKRMGRIRKGTSPGPVTGPGTCRLFYPWKGGKGGATANPSRRCRGDQCDARSRGRTLFLRFGRSGVVARAPGLPALAPGFPVETGP
jgi:hypothetical protein